MSVSISFFGDTQHGRPNNGSRVQNIILNYNFQKKKKKKEKRKKEKKKKNALSSLSTQLAYERDQLYICDGFLSYAGYY